MYLHWKKGKIHCYSMFFRLVKYCLINNFNCLFITFSCILALSLFYPFNISIGISKSSRNSCNIFLFLLLYNLLTYIQPELAADRVQEPLVRNNLLHKCISFWLQLAISIVMLQFKTSTTSVTLHFILQLHVLAAHQVSLPKCHWWVIA